MHTDQTERLILDAAVAVLEASSLRELTVRAVAQEARISERTVFRYFPTRDVFLDAIAGEVIARLQLPRDPTTRDELLALPRALFETFEQRASLTRAALHSELFPRIRDRAGGDRWKAIQKLVDRLAPRRSRRARQVAATNIRFFLSAMTWNYYRGTFRFSLERTIECAETAILQALDALE